MIKVRLLKSKKRQGIIRRRRNKIDFLLRHPLIEDKTLLRLKKLVEEEKTT